MRAAFSTWFNSAPLPWIAVCVVGGMFLAAFGGHLLHVGRGRTAPSDKESTSGQEGYVVSATLGLLALLMGFTFGLAVERFETRRSLVLQEANAIGTTYLRVQLLPEPHRKRLTELLARYVDNRIVLAKAGPGQVSQRLAVNDAILIDVWAATAAAFDEVKGLPFSNSLLETVNGMIDMDSSRKAARQAHVPREVFAVLFVYQIVAAGVMGYVLLGTGPRWAGGFLLLLNSMAFLLIVDIDRPTLGGIRESQAPMEALRDSIAGAPPATYDKWRTKGP